MSGRNGELPAYEICECHDLLVIKGIIEDSPAQRNFTFLDVGAGKYTWGRSVSEYLNQEFGGKGLTFRVIGVRGEQNPETTIIEDGCVTRFELGAFKIEEISSEFTKCELTLKDEVDGAWASWTMRHLQDSVGTLKQIVELLRPGKGMLSFDGFVYALEGDDLSPSSLVKNIFPYISELLQDTGNEFLAFPVLQTDNYHFILKRKSSEPCKIPFSYERRETIIEIPSHSSEGIIVFKRQTPRPDVYKMTLDDFNSLNFNMVKLAKTENFYYFYNHQGDRRILCFPDTAPSGSLSILKWIIDKGFWKISNE